jgi:DNA-binding CsgD family transcriptional regulator
MGESCRSLKKTEPAEFKAAAITGGSVKTRSRTFPFFGTTGSSITAKRLGADKASRAKRLHKGTADSAWDLDAIVGAFAAAAVDPSLWCNAMEIASAQLGGCGAALFPLHGRLPSIPISQSLAPSFEAYVRDGWIQRDRRYEVLPTLAARGVGSDLDFTTPDQMAKDPYYQEFLAPFGLQWSAIVRVAAADVQWCMSVQRSKSQGPFQKDELAKLSDLSQRLSGAAALARTLGFARVQAALSAFEISNFPAIMLDQFGCVLRLNAAALAVLGRDLFISQRRLRSARQIETDALDQAIHRLLRIADSTMLPPLTLRREKGRPVLLFLSRPIGIAVEALSPCRGLILILDPDRHLQCRAETLVNLFGLSPAESRLAIALLDGWQLEAAAHELKVSYETARTTLKRIFQKTGTERQAELMLLLAKIASTSPNQV